MNLAIVLPIVSVALIAAFVLWGIIYSSVTGKPFIVVNSAQANSNTTSTETAIEGQPATLNEIQGTWRMIVCGKRGNFAPTDKLALADIRMTVSGDQLTALHSGETDQLRVDDAVFPTAIDQISTDGKITRCIARIVDGQLEFCQADPGKRRPTDFSREGSNPNTVVRFVRLSHSSENAG